MLKTLFTVFVLLGVALYSVAQNIDVARAALEKDTALAGAHLGISMLDPATGKYLYNYQGDKYFVPASNTKLFTCYAAMKYLGDSLVGARYNHVAGKLNIQASADPSFLHPDYPTQPLLKLLQSGEKQVAVSYNGNVVKYGPGWGWDDYESDYMAERSPFPMFGNVIWISDKPTLSDTNLERVTRFGQYQKSFYVKPAYFVNRIGSENPTDRFTINRPQEENIFWTKKSDTRFSQEAIPFVTNDYNTSVEILQSLLPGKEITKGMFASPAGKGSDSLMILHSQPTDSLLKPMMYRSDNFFAEQSLLMVSNEKLGYMNDEAIIDTLLKTDFKNLPQKPVWVDGCGLSRYNLFTPQDIVAVLLKMKNEFGLDRIRNILPKGNTGTLTNYYQKIGNDIFAKTGSLSGQICLGGYLICRSGKLLVFSVMVNNHNSSGRAVRRAVEKFVTQVWEKN